MATLRKLPFFFLAMVILGAGGCSQTEVSEQKQPIIEKLLQSAEQGDPKAQYELGLMYAKGDGVPEDYQEAVKWYRKAAEQGQASAQSKLGGMYYLGQGVPTDYKEAAKWFQLAAEQIVEAQRLPRE